MPESLFFSPERDVSTGPFKSDANTTDVVLRRERETNQTLQAALDRAYELLGPLKARHENADVSASLRKLQKEHLALESSLNKEKVMNASLSGELQRQKECIQEYKKLFDYAFERVGNLIREDSWRLPEYTQDSRLLTVPSTNNLNSVEDIRKEMTAQLDRLVTVRNVLGEHQRDEIVQRSAADIRSTKAELASMHGQLSDQQRLIAELTKTVELQKERIQAQKDTIESLQAAVGAAIASSVATQTEVMEEETHETVEEPVPGLEFHDTVEDSSPRASPAFGRMTNEGLVTRITAADPVSLEPMSDDVETLMLASQDVGPDGPTQAGSQPDSPEGEDAIARSMSPTPRLDSLFSTTRRPRIRLRAEPPSKDGQTLTTVESQRSRKIVKKTPKTPTTPTAASKKDDTSTQSTIVSTRIGRNRRQKVTPADTGSQ